MYEQEGNLQLKLALSNLSAHLAVELAKKRENKKEGDKKLEAKPVWEEQPSQELAE